MTPAAAARRPRGTPSTPQPCARNAHNARNPATQGQVSCVLGVPCGRNRPRKIRIGEGRTIATTAGTDETLPFDPPAGRGCLRLSTVYATSSALDVDEAAALGKRASTFLRLGRLATFYDASHEQLPAVLGRQALDVAALTFQRWTGPIDAAWLWLFVLPSGQITAAITLDVTTELIPAIPLLEDLYYANLAVAGMPLAEHLAQLAADIDPHPDPFELLPERHQLVFAHTPADEMPSDDVMQRLIYRADLPARNGNGNSAICHPPELNRRPTTVGALGPYVSVIIGTQDYVENAALLTAVQVVAAGARLRQIRQQAYDGVAALRTSSRPDASMRDRRFTLEDIANRLRSLELDLSYSVEAVADLGMLIPALRVESYHQALIDSMSLAKRAATTGRMLERLANAIDAELTSVQSVEARTDDARRTRTAIAVTFITTTAGTIGLLFAFLGINAREVSEQRSMFDSHYLPIYAVITALMLAGVAVFAALTWVDRGPPDRPHRQRRRGQPGEHRADLRTFPAGGDDGLLGRDLLVATGRPHTGRVSRAS